MGVKLQFGNRSLRLKFSFITRPEVDNDGAADEDEVGSSALFIISPNVPPVSVATSVLAGSKADAVSTTPLISSYLVALFVELVVVAIPPPLKINGSSTSKNKFVGGGVEDGAMTNAVTPPPRRRSEEGDGGDDDNRSRRRMEYRRR
jgi:hypothetical protein